LLKDLEVKASFVKHVSSGAAKYMVSFGPELKICTADPIEMMMRLKLD
jgi:hypothetical protein